MSFSPMLKNRVRRLEMQEAESVGIAERIRRAEARTQQERSEAHAATLKWAQQIVAAPEGVGQLEARLARATLRAEQRL